MTPVVTCGAFLYTFNAGSVQNDMCGWWKHGCSMWNAAEEEQILSLVLIPVGWESFAAQCQSTSSFDLSILALLVIERQTVPVTCKLQYRGVISECKYIRYSMKAFIKKDFSQYNITLKFGGSTPTFRHCFCCFPSHLPVWLYSGSKCFLKPMTGLSWSSHCYWRRYLYVLFWFSPTIPLFCCY